MSRYIDSPRVDFRTNTKYGVSRRRGLIWECNVTDNTPYIWIIHPCYKINTITIRHVRMFRGIVLSCMISAAYEILYLRTMLFFLREFSRGVSPIAKYSPWNIHNPKSMDRCFSASLTPRDRGVTTTSDSIILVIPNLEGIVNLIRSLIRITTRRSAFDFPSLWST